VGEQDSGGKGVHMEKGSSVNIEVAQARRKFCFHKRHASRKKKRKRHHQKGTEEGAIRRDGGGKARLSKTFALEPLQMRETQRRSFKRIPSGEKPAWKSKFPKLEGKATCKIEYKLVSQPKRKFELGTEF